MVNFNPGGNHAGRPLTLPEAPAPPGHSAQGGGSRETQVLAHTFSLEELRGTERLREWPSTSRCLRAV